MGEKGKVLDDPLLSLAGRKPRASKKQSSDTLCGSVRQEADGVGAELSLEETGAMSEVQQCSAMGSWVRGSLL
jgi:hypothetical protein